MHLIRTVDGAQIYPLTTLRSDISASSNTILTRTLGSVGSYGFLPAMKYYLEASYGAGRGQTETSAEVRSQVDLLELDDRYGL